MPAILEIPEVRDRVMPLSVDAYHGMIEQGMVSPRAELLEGIIIEKMSKSPLHTRLSHRLFEMIRARLGSGLWVRLEAPLTLPALRSEPEPDISVVEGADVQYAESHPSTARLVVEVSVSSADADRNLATVYAAAGVAEYWIILGSEEAVEVYTRPAASGYVERRRVERGDRLVSTACPGVEVVLESLFGK